MVTVFTEDLLSLHNTCSQNACEITTMVLPILALPMFISKLASPLALPVYKAKTQIVAVIHSKKERADTTCIRVLIECPRI